MRHILLEYKIILFVKSNEDFNGLILITILNHQNLWLYQDFH